MHKKIRRARVLLITAALALLALAAFAVSAWREAMVGAQGQPPSLEELSKKVAALEKSLGDLRKSDEEGLKAITALSLTDPPVGTILAFAGEFPPKRDENRRWTEDELGWMRCNGDPKSTKELKELFLAIGYSWGGSGDTFNLPALGGRFLRGIDTGENLDPDKGGRLNRDGKVGPVVGSLQGDTLQGHKHLDAGHIHPVTKTIPFALFATEDERVDCGDSCHVNGNEGNHDRFDQPTVRVESGRADIGDPSESTFGVPRIGTETRPKNAYVHFIIKFKSSRNITP